LPVVDISTGQLQDAVRVGYEVEQYQAEGGEAAGGGSLKKAEAGKGGAGEGESLETR
jgi:hypothetical protein